MNTDHPFSNNLLFTFLLSSNVKFLQGKASLAIESFSVHQDSGRTP
jgi:hypothetical protein